MPLTGQVSKGGDHTHGVSGARQASVSWGSGLKALALTFAGIFVASGFRGAGGRPINVGDAGSIALTSVSDNTGAHALARRADFTAAAAAAQFQTVDLRRSGAADLYIPYQQEESIS